MGSLLRRIWDSRLARLGLPVLALAGGAALFGLLAWREADRARQTAELLMRDYARVVADKFTENIARTYRAQVGLEGQETSSGLTPYSKIRRYYSHIDKGSQAALPAPSDDSDVLYFFFYDRKDNGLEISGRSPAAEELQLLEETLQNTYHNCSPGRPHRLIRISDYSVKGAGQVEWSGVFETDEDGEVVRIAGFRVDERKLLQATIIPVIEEKGCCPEMFLPSSLAGVEDVREAASFTVRDQSGRILYESFPQYQGSGRVSSPLDLALPVVGWTTEVVINPEVVRPLLPYEGRGFPLVALILPAILVLAAVGLAVRSIRKESELFRLRQGFVSNVSHELKTPLTRIRLFNELLESGKQEDQEKRRRYYRVIDRECRRLTQLVENVLDFSRSSRQASVGRTENVDLCKIVREAVETFQCGDLERYPIQLNLVPVAKIQADPQGIYQAVINLLDNAIKYSPQNSPIKIRVFNNQGSVRLEVEDRGCGIPKKHLGRVFEEFYRVETGDRQLASGSGLGLTLVKRSVEAQGGSIDISSRPGAGTVVRVDLPRKGPIPVTHLQPDAPSAAAS